MLFTIFQDIPQKSNLNWGFTQSRKIVKFEKCKDISEKENTLHKNMHDCMVSETQIIKVTRSEENLICTRGPPALNSCLCPKRQPTSTVSVLIMIMMMIIMMVLMMMMMIGEFGDEHASEGQYWIRFCGLLLTAARRSV